MKNFIKQYLHGVYRCLVRVKSVWRLLTEKSLTSTESYYPEMKDKRRSRLGIFFRQLRHIMKYGYPNEFYFLYGLDIKNFREDSDYVDYSEFMERRDKLNRIHRDSSVAVLRNKFLFGLTARALHIPSPQDIGIVENERLYLIDTHEYVDFESYIASSRNDVFLKSIDGECADGVYHLEFSDGDIKIDGEPAPYETLRRITQTGKFILQQKIFQIKALRDLHPNSINTIRLETVCNRKTKTIEILPPLLRVGTRRHEVDNWAIGGFAIEINTEKRCLGKYGYYKPSYGTKEVRHPDTGIVFEGYEIPFLNEAIEMAKRFHSYLTDVHSIGWDIAITEDGPCFIEGNDNWEISLVQGCSRGIMPEFKRLFY